MIRMIISIDKRQAVRACLWSIRRTGQEHYFLNNFSSNWIMEITINGSIAAGPGP